MEEFMNTNNVCRACLQTQISSDSTRAVRRAKNSRGKSNNPAPIDPNAETILTTRAGQFGNFNFNE